MTREEALTVAQKDSEIIVQVPLELSARIEELECKIASLTRILVIPRSLLHPMGRPRSPRPASDEIQEAQTRGPTGI